MGREGSPATMCRFYPGGQAAASPWLGSQPERPDGAGSQAEACRREGSLQGQLRSGGQTGGASERGGEPVRTCVHSLFPCWSPSAGLEGRRWRVDLKGRTTGTGGRRCPISPCSFREIRWRVVLGGNSSLGQAGVSSEVAPSPWKTKLQEPQICLLCPSLRKDLRLWFRKSFLRTRALPRNFLFQWLGQDS